MNTMPETALASLQPGQIVTGLGGGLALFLFGMRVMTEGLKTGAGPGMKQLLGKLTGNRFSAMLGGAVVTAVIQSSSVTTVLLVGFITAGVMTFKQSIGVIIGANIGTTLTAQIIAFKVTQYGLVLIAVGFLIEAVSKRERWKQAGTAVLGLGLIFFGMELMTSATTPLRSWAPFLQLMQHLRNPLAGIAAGAVFTAIVQSSSATTGIVIVLASGGFISLEAGIALIFGANVGTCVTATLSSFGKPREAMQATVVHVMFNLIGVLLWVAFIPQFADLMRILSPVASVEQLATQTPRQIANAHTIFNIANAFLFIGLTGPLAKLTEWLVPARPTPVPGKITPKFLDDYFLEQPSVALDLVRKELLRLSEMVDGMLKEILRITTRGTVRDLTVLQQLDDDIDTLHGQIVAYLGQLSLQELVEPQPRVLHEYIAIANYLENSADVMSTNMAEGLQRRLKLGASVSESTRSVLLPIHEDVTKAFHDAIAGLRDDDITLAQAAVDSKSAVKQLAENAGAHLARRLIAEEPYRVPLFQIESDIIENLSRLNTLTRRIGRAVITGNQREQTKEIESIPNASQQSEARSPMDQMESP